MVLQYANQGTLRHYLQNNFASLNWVNKIEMAFDLACGLLCLHTRDIVHRDLHAKNILVHKNVLMISDFGLSKRLNSDSIYGELRGMPAYVDPQCFKIKNYHRDKKSDIYSLGVLLWELTSGYPPFLQSTNDELSRSENGYIVMVPISLMLPDELSGESSDINQEECDNSSTVDTQSINEKKLECANSSSMDIQSIDEHEDELINSSSFVESQSVDDECNNSSPVVIQSIDEKKLDCGNSSLIDTHEHEEELFNSLSSVDSQSVDENKEECDNSSLVILQSINETSAALYEIIQNYVIYNHVGDSKNFNFTKILKNFLTKSRDIFGFLVENPSIQHYELMIGVFYEMGFGIEKNKTKAFDWYKKAGDKEDVYGLYKVGYYYFDGWGEAAGDDEHYKLAFEFYEAAASGELNIAIHMLAFFYEYGFHVQKDYDEAFKLYKKAAENGFIPSQVELSRYYYSGRGTQKDKMEALKWYQLYQKNDGLINVSDEIKKIERKMEKQEDGTYIYKRSKSILNVNYFQSSKNNDIYGVLPFVAPEVLRGQPYTLASDIYSFSMIMWEFISGIPPFDNKAHDFQLSLEICKGKRPKIIENIPQCYIALMKKCWDSDPLKRPTASEIINIIGNWYQIIDGYETYNYVDEKLLNDFIEFQNADGILEQELLDSNTFTIAIYSTSLELYGITQDPETLNYIIIMQEAICGNLGSNLAIKKYNPNDKFHNLYTVAKALSALHKCDLIHGDLHGGNLLLHDSELVFISDLGLCRPVNKQSDEIYGVLPYVAPEVFSSKMYTKAADIYSFGIIMWEMTSGIPAFHNIVHNLQLSSSIRRGLRPITVEGTLPEYAELMKKCWDPDPSQRPTADILENIFDEWRRKYPFNYFNRITVPDNNEFIIEYQSSYISVEFNLKKINSAESMEDSLSEIISNPTEVLTKENSNDLMSLLIEEELSIDPEFYTKMINYCSKKLNEVHKNDNIMIYTKQIIDCTKNSETKMTK
ncbi:11112_t:CDS:2 [Funneliformis geosporum]|uniref:11112_t:CDS:1 n=1 Tax=Funneliformis geosporum TaxID=1117311 RepID=A0A9W4SJD4_9GLOM|nr:11112_t:CDS:2 [Funneliformis geosporum]